MIATELFDYEIGKGPSIVWRRGQYVGRRYFDVHEHLPDDAIGAPGVPQPGDAYSPAFPEAVAVGIEPEPAPYRHYVRVDYESPGEFGFGGNPEPLGTRLVGSSGQLQVRRDANKKLLLEPITVKVKANKLVLRTQQSGALWEEAWQTLLHDGPFPLVNSTGAQLKALEGLNAEQSFNAPAFSLLPDSVNQRALQPGLMQVDFVFEYGRDLHKVVQANRDEAGNPRETSDPLFQEVEFDAYKTTDYTPFLEVVLP